MVNEQYTTVYHIFALQMASILIVYSSLRKVQSRQEAMSLFMCLCFQQSWSTPTFTSNTSTSKAVFSCQNSMYSLFLITLMSACIKD